MNRFAFKADGVPAYAENGRREARQFWVADSDARRVIEATGYICENSPGAWWVPSLGFTMWEGKRLFPTRPEAVSALLKFLTDERDALSVAIQRLEGGQ